VGEAEKGECIWTPFATLPPSESWQSAKLDQPCFVLVERKAKLRQSLLEVCYHLPRVRRFLKAHHKVVGIPDDRHATAGLSATPLMDPEIEGVVQHDVGEERTSGSLNAKDNFRFERVITGWRDGAVVDLRRKR
jgi:hypothetical protein